MDYGYFAYKDKLNDEYKEAFSKVELYSSTHMIDAETDSEWMMELIDSMLEAQDAGEPVEKVVGTDIDRFCEEFFGRYTGNDRLRAMFRKIYGMMKLILILEIIDCLLAEDGSLLTGASEVLTPFLWGTAIGIAGSTVIGLIINPLFIKNKKLSLKAYNVYNTVIILLVIFAVVGSLVTAGWAEENMGLIINRGMVLAVSGAYVIIYMLIAAVRNYKQYGTLRAPKDPKVGMKDMVKADVEAELPKEWLKQLEKKNKGLVKKGKPELTSDEFMEKLVKRYDYKRQRLINFVSVISGAIVGVAMIMADEGAFTAEEFEFFESVGDMIFFFVLVFGGASLLAVLLSKLQKPGCEMFAKVKEACDDNGWTLQEYVEKNCGEE